MKLTERIEQKKSISEEICKFFESLDYDKAEITEIENYIHVSFKDYIDIKEYPFPMEEDKGVFKIIGILNISYHMVKDNKKFVRFEFDVDKDIMNKIWYK